MVDINLLETIAKEIRAKFETTDLSDAPGFMIGFPDGCCSWASYMIGHFLKYELQLNPIEIQAERYSPDGTDPHSWLMVDDVIIDITSDEFEDSSEKVIVTRNSPWHNSWKIVNTIDVVKIETYDQIDYGTELKPSDVYKLLIDTARKIAHNNSLNQIGAKIAPPG